MQASIIFTTKVTPLYSPTFLKGEESLRELGFHQLPDSYGLRSSSVPDVELELISTVRKTCRDQLAYLIKANTTINLPKNKLLLLQKSQFTFEYISKPIRDTPFKKQYNTKPFARAVWFFISAFMENSHQTFPFKSARISPVTGLYRENGKKRLLKSLV